MAHTNVQLVSGNLTTGGADPTFFIDRVNNKVGIGDVPDTSGDDSSNVLQVTGNMLATKYHGDGSSLTGLSDSKWLEYSGDATKIYYNGGNVGIGTASPSAPLTVVSTRNADTWASDKSQLKVLNDNSSGATYGMSFAVSQSRGDGIIQTFNNNSGGAEYDLCLQPNAGNVGIGTTTPNSTLEVHGTGIHINGTVLRAMSAIGSVTTGTFVKLCDFSALPASTNGVCAISIRWGGGSGGGTYYYWQGHATGIVGFNTYGDGNGTYNGSGVEPLTLNHHYHFRTVGVLAFQIDSDNSGGSYGRQSIYVAPNASLDSMSFEVIAIPLRR